MILLLAAALAREEASLSAGVVTMPMGGVALRVQNPEQWLYFEVSAGYQPRQNYAYGTLTFGHVGGWSPHPFLRWDPQIGGMVTWSPLWGTDPAYSVVLDPIAVRWRPDDGHLRPRVGLRVGATARTDQVSEEEHYFGMDTLYFGLTGSILLHRIP